MSNYTSRRLEHHEITDPATDWFRKSTSHEWRPWDHHFSVGAMAAIHGSGFEIERRTPIEVIKQPVCADGYRWMKEGESTQHADEAKSNSGWHQVIAPGSIPPKLHCDLHEYRRPINQDGTDLWQMVNGVLARKMQVGEKKQHGDFFGSDGDCWHNYQGHQMGCAVHVADYHPSYRPAPTQPAKPLESPESTKAAPEPEKQATEAPEKPDGVLDYFKDRMRLMDLDIQELIDDRNKWKALAERQTQTLDNIRAEMDEEAE